MDIAQADQVVKVLVVDHLHSAAVKVVEVAAVAVVAVVADTHRADQAAKYQEQLVSNMLQMVDTNTDEWRLSILSDLHP